MSFYLKYVFTVLFFQNRQVTSELLTYAFQEGQYGLRRADTDSGETIGIQEGQYRFRRANTDSGGPIRIQEGQYGFRRANTKPSMHFW